MERLKSTIVELSKFAHFQDSRAVAMKIGLAFVASRKTTEFKRNARNTVSFVVTQLGLCIAFYVLRK